MFTDNDENSRTSHIMYIVAAQDVRSIYLHMCLAMVGSFPVAAICQ